MPAKHEQSPLDTLEDAFALLVTQPAPLALDGATLGPDLPARPMPLDELRTLLLRRSTPYPTRDRAMAELLRRAKAEPAWLVGLAGVLLPGLRRIAGRVSRDFPGNSTADVDAEILAGLVEAVRSIEPCGKRLAGRLLSVPWNRAKAVRRAEVAYAGRKAPPNGSVPPKRPWGHPDFVLARAVAADIITDEEAELIGATRVGDAPLDALAAELGVSYGTVRRRRYRAECRLVRWLSNGSSAVPSGSRRGLCGVQVGVGAASPGSRTLRHGPRHRGGEHPTAGPSPRQPTRLTQRA